MEQLGGTSLQKIPDLLWVKERPFSDPHTSPSTRDVACPPSWLVEVVRRTCELRLSPAPDL
jgi:hypothetical protein